MSKQFRRSDASKLNEEHIKHIISLRNTIPNAAIVAAKIYKISISRVYQIWKSGTELAQHMSAPEPLVNPMEIKRIIDLNAQLFSINSTINCEEDTENEVKKELEATENEVKKELEEVKKELEEVKKELTDTENEKLKLQNDVDQLRTILNKLIS